MIPFLLFNWLFVFTRFRICGAKCWQHVWEIFMQEKHIKLYIKPYVLIFCIYEFLLKYSCTITYTCKNHHQHANYHNLNYWIFSLKFFLYRFYIWNITKTKSLSPMSKNECFDCEYALWKAKCLIMKGDLYIERD